MAIKGVRMPAQELSGTTALVTGASRGFGRAIAVALSKHDAHVAVARDHGRLGELRALLGDTFTPVAADPVVASQLLDKHRPRTLVLNAGAAPLPRPVHRQTWQILGRVHYSWFPQVRTMGVQVGVRSRNGNNPDGTTS
jgi:NAD(P)-dependent dehydrogenase (short-subunit alcohol dehydrogenase family)